MSSVPRFFLSPADFADGRAALPPDDAHHARTVLRLRPGARVTLLDGTGTAHDAVLVEVGPERVVARVESSSPCETEPRTRITVAQALPKNEDKVEQALQHGTEIGAAGFHLFLAARSVARPDEARLKKRLERWRGIVKSAAQQSGRGALPGVGWGFPASDENAVVLVLHEKASVPLTRALADVPASTTHFVIAVGPEGGFTEEEVGGFGGRAVSLGPRILRTETAALVALAQILVLREG